MVPDERQKKLDNLPAEYKHKFTIDNNGNLVFKNRAYRRRKPPADNWYTKNTHAIKKKRDKIRAKIKHNRRPAEA